MIFSNRVAAVRSELLERRITDPNQSPVSERPQEIDSMMSQLRAAFNDNDAVSDQMISLTLERGIDLLRMGRFEQAKELLDLLNKSDNAERSQQIRTDFEYLQTGVALSDTPLDISCMRTIDDQPAQFRIANSKRKVLYFASSGGYQQSVGGFNDLISRLGEQLRTRQDLELVLVYLDPGDNAQALESVRTAINLCGKQRGAHCGPGHWRAIDRGRSEIGALHPGS